MTIAMGASDKAQAASAASLKGINGEQFTRLTEAALRGLSKVGTLQWLGFVRAEPRRTDPEERHA